MRDEFDDAEPKPESFKPPYMSFQTFWRFIEELRAKPLPPQIDRSLMRSKSGTDQANLNATLDALGLVGPAGEVRAELKALVHGDDEGRRRVLAEIVRHFYPAPIAVSDQNGTNQQLQEAFRDAYGMTAGETRRKAVTFFLHACREAGIELSPYFPSTRAGAGAPGAARARKPRPRRTAAPTVPEATSQPATVTHSDVAGDRYSVPLASGGTVAVIVDVNLFDLTTDDRNFVIELIDKLKGYGPAKPAAAEVPS
ncbi:MAG TPA: hypothetical protein VF557_14110 [Jatrophihabitans sp.]|jgi:hypothetical protein|uniref:hypothetical protein n=1 Tax=Jatrophihabitans sp. TaxID=1932789 RepID=UPI002F1063EF